MNLANKLQERVVDYINSFTFEELRDLAIYLGAGIMQSVVPTKQQQKFCETFLGTVNYGEYLKYHSLESKDRPYFTSAHKTGIEIQELYGFISFQCVLRSSEVLLDLSKEKVKSSKLELKIAKEELKQATLKEDLANGIVDSFEDNVFYKDNGWCNISEVLMKYKLIELTED